MRVSPGSVSPGGTPRQKMSKAVAPRDTNLDSERELTNSNLFLFQGSSEKETRRLYHLKLDNHRTSLDRKSGQAYSDPETFMKSHRLHFHSGKTIDRPIPSRKSEDSPRTASPGKSPLRKRGPQYYSRDARTLFGYCPR